MQRAGDPDLWEAWPIDALAGRVWDLRPNLPADDAASVALAERLEIPLVTFHRRIAHAPGIRCEVIVPA